MMTQNHETTVYTADLVAFIRIAIEYCAVIEKAESRLWLLKHTIRLLPQVYLGLHVLPEYAYSPDTDYLQEHITEDMYEQVRTRLKDQMGRMDDCLALVSEASDDAPIAGALSECLADLYQHLGNFVGIIRDMNELTVPLAVGRLIQMGREHWGSSLLVALGAIHQLWQAGLLAEDEEEAEQDIVATSTFDWQPFSMMKR